MNLGSAPTSSINSTSLRFLRIVRTLLFLRLELGLPGSGQLVGKLLLVPEADALIQHPRQPSQLLEGHCHLLAGRAEHLNVGPPVIQLEDAEPVAELGLRLGLG